MLRTIIEGHKAYPKDWMTRGRFKVEILDDKKKPIYPHITNSTIVFDVEQKLMKEIGQKLIQCRKK
jgi:hypothetical protein